MTTSASPARPRAHDARPPSRWILPAAPDESIVSRLVAELSLPTAVCRLLASRGFCAPDDAKRFLRPRLEQLHPVGELLDLDRATERVARAITAREKIMVHGDYDVDGICSTALLTRAIQSLGGDVTPFIPHRIEDGYDLGAAGVRRARELGAALVVTCDCGTSAHAAVAELQSSGIDVVVTDHHLPSGDISPAFATVNPRRPGCGSSDKDLAGVGIAFKLSLSVTQSLGGNENVVFGMLDLVALATIADVAPLRGENRILVRYGLRLLAESRNLGLRALVRAAGLDRKPLTAGRVGFILAPRLNAVGRLGRALRGVELLLADSEHEANVIARELEEMNARRQQLDRATLDQAREMARTLDMDSVRGIVLAGEGWHPGVIGIVASRIVEEFARPAVLIALDGDEGKGSGRSISAFDLHAGLERCRDLFVRFGGHRSAAGVTIKRENVAEFARRFDEVARAALTDDDLVPELRVDLEVTLAEVDDDLELLLRHLEPCGVGNPAPVLVARNVRLVEASRCDGKEREHLRLLLDAGARELTAVGWGMGARSKEIPMGAPIDIAFRLERDEWNGVSRLQAKIADFRA